MELIIVIAIMAILVGVMAPQLIKYIEKTNVSSDTQLCDSVKTAITTAMMDPAVINAATPGLPASDTDIAITGITSGGAFEASVKEILGVNTLADINGQIKSSAKAAGGVVTFRVVGSNSVHVWITNSDNTGAKDATNPDIYVD